MLFYDPPIIDQVPSFKKRIRVLAILVLEIEAPQVSMVSLYRVGRKDSLALKRKLNDKIIDTYHKNAMF